MFAFYSRMLWPKSSIPTPLATALCSVGKASTLRWRRPLKSLRLTYHGLSPVRQCHISPFATRGFEQEAAPPTTIAKPREVVEAVPAPEAATTTTETTATRSPAPTSPGEVLAAASRSNIPQAARTPFFIHRWRQVTTNKWILSVAQDGYKLQFDPDPPPPRPFFPSSYSPSSSHIIRSLLIDYLNKGAIKKVDARPDQFVSRIFEVPKKTGDYRLILDLHDLNTYLKKVHFKMEGLHTISSLIHLDDFLASLDLQDAFLTIPMHPDFFKFLCFDFDGVRYCFVALVFGLSCAPRVFTKLLKVPLSALRLEGIRNSAWLDDILLVGPSFQVSSDIVSRSRAFLESFGFIIKPSKSNLVPSQTLRHVGFVWDSVQFSVSIPRDKLVSLQSLCSSALSSPISLTFLAKIIGTIESFRFGCPVAALHYRSLQFDLLPHLSDNTVWSQTISLSSSARSDLEWWLGCGELLPPATLAPFSPSYILETDASLVGWGAYLHSSAYTQGRWSYTESRLHINFLELKAIFLGVRALFPGYSPISLLVRCDNVSAVSYINHQGGTKSWYLCQMSLALWEYCISHNIRLKAVYFRGTDNSRADTLSRFFLDNHDYYLSAAAFSSLLSHLDVSLDIDLFASRLHHRLPRYSSLLPDYDAEFIDAFSLPWSGNLYLFPPIVIIDRVLAKFINDNCLYGILIAPFRPSSPYFSTILDLCISPPIILPFSAVVSEKRHCKISQMMAWTISCSPSLRRDYLKTLSPTFSKWPVTSPSSSTSRIGRDLRIGVTEGVLILATYL